MKGIQGTSNQTYRQLMGNGLKYQVPKFQRDYTWEEEQWDDLWQDILLVLSHEENEHYMGYLVLQTTDNKEFIIIDGQQRMTTLSILILAILKVLTDLVNKGMDVEDNNLRIDTYRKSYIGTLNTITLISDNKLKLNRNSDEYYRNNIVLLKDLPLRNTNTSEKHMRECFLWFYRRVSENFNTGTEIAQFIETMVDKLVFTVITVTDEINAFKVFETLNARGVQLSASDLLKNYLFSIIDQTQPHKSEIEELENLWSRITGKLGNNNFEDYLRYYWNSKNLIVRKNQLFKIIRNAIKTKEDTFTLIRDLDDTADLFMAIQDPNSEFWYDYKDVKKYLKELKLFQIKQTNSLLLAGYKNLNKAEFIKLVKITAIISFRYNVIGGLNPNEQEDIYNKISRKISSDNVLDIQSFHPIYVSDKNFENDFSTKEFKNSTKNHKLIKYILTRIEKYQFGHEIDPESDSFTVEHILPENADDTWGQFTMEEINRSVYRIGNLTLLEKKLNNEAGAKPYKQKVMYFKKSTIKMTNYIEENYDYWSEDKIVSRQMDLARQAKGIWVIQELSNKK